MTPTLPFSTPHKQRLEKPCQRCVSLLQLKTYLITRLQKFVERPKHSIEIQAPSSPMDNTGLRPMRSDNRLHLSTVSACATKNRDSCQSYPIDSMRTIIIASRNMGTYNYSSIISYRRIIPSSDAKFSDKLRRTKQHQKWMLQTNAASL